MAKVADDTQTDWDVKIDTVLMGYRASQQASTKKSPYYMLFQQEMCLPIDNEVAPSATNVTLDIPEVIEQLLESREKAFQDADSNIKKAQKKQKETYDRKHLQSALPAGTLVLLENTKENREREENCSLSSSALIPFTVTLEKVCMSSPTPVEKSSRRRQTSQG